MKNIKVSIIGLGLIGGSLARALHERLNITDITAVDRCSESIKQALKDKSISRGFEEVNEYVFNSDVIFICTPVQSAVNFISILKDRVKPRCIVTDVCSTKGEIINYVNSTCSSFCFIGGHPMAGTEKEGYAASFSHLFENAYYILTPANNTNEASLNCMIELVKGIGSIPVIMDANEHDKITGGISHVPHIIASALVNLIREMDSPDGNMRMLAAGGFKDITRIASSNPEMWENIILSNKHQIIDIMEKYIYILHQFKDYVENSNSELIYKFFESARNYRESFPVGKKSLISQSYELIVDVVDKPGIIGQIATILGNNNINIKNINISNSREYEQGCLRITLPDSYSLCVAYDLLSNIGYKVYKLQ